MGEGRSYGLGSFLEQSDAVSIIVLLILLAMSIASWYLIVLKAARGARMKLQAREFLAQFCSASSVEWLAGKLSQQPPRDPFGKIAAHGLQAAGQFRRSASSGLVEAERQNEFVTRAIRRAITGETAALESGLTVLASVGSTAPFVGLFGTVWGIYHALIAIGTSRSASLDAVAGPVGEALIMTAAGLAVAIPAVLGYNFFVRSNRVIVAELDGFAHDLHAFVIMGTMFDGRPAAGTVPHIRSPAAGRTGTA